MEVFFISGSGGKEKCLNNEMGDVDVKMKAPSFPMLPTESSNPLGPSGNGGLRGSTSLWCPEYPAEMSDRDALRLMSPPLLTKYILCLCLSVRLFPSLSLCTHTYTHTHPTHTLHTHIHTHTHTITLLSTHTVFQSSEPPNPPVFLFLSLPPWLLVSEVRVFVWNLNLSPENKLWVCEPRSWISGPLLHANLVHLLYT